MYWSRNDEAVFRTAYYSRIKRTFTSSRSSDGIFYPPQSGEKRGKREEETISSLAWMGTCFRGQVTPRTRGRENPRTDEPRAMTCATPPTCAEKWMPRLSLKRFASEEKKSRDFTYLHKLGSWFGSWIKSFEYYIVWATLYITILIQLYEIRFADKRTQVWHIACAQ